MQQLLGDHGLPLQPAHLLHLATAAGADALGLTELGDLSVGKRFDAIWLRPAPSTTLDVALRSAGALRTRWPRRSRWRRPPMCSRCGSTARGSPEGASSSSMSVPPEFLAVCRLADRGAALELGGPVATAPRTSGNARDPVRSGTGELAAGPDDPSAGIEATAVIQWLSTRRCRRCVRTTRVRALKDPPPTRPRGHQTGDGRVRHSHRNKQRRSELWSCPFTPRSSDTRTASSQLGHPGCAEASRRHACRAPSGQAGRGPATSSLDAANAPVLPAVGDQRHRARRRRGRAHRPAPCTCWSSSKRDRS